MANTISRDRIKKIYDAIAQFQTGISTTQLEKATKLHRNTLLKACQILKRQKCIEIDRIVETGAATSARENLFWAIAPLPATTDAERFAKIAQILGAVRKPTSWDKAFKDEILGAIEEAFDLAYTVPENPCKKGEKQCLHQN